MIAMGALAFGARAAHAGDPAFDYGKREDKAADRVEWKVSAQAGILLTTGNSQSTTTSGSLTASRKHHFNKLQLDLSGAYARSSLLVAVDQNGDKMVQPGEITRVTTTTTNAYLGKLRYDRFFTEHNSAFVTARVGADVPAGKDHIGGGQLGYSRQLYKDEMHELVGEAGYDFSYESYVAPNTDALSIQSARLFGGYTGTLSKDTAVTLAIEALINLSSEKNPVPGGSDITLGQDTRINAKAGVTTKLGKYLSFRFTFTARYDNAPAPAPLIGGVPYAMGFVPLADKLDTITEVALIVSFL
jgi:hypothetical protein